MLILPAIFVLAFVLRLYLASNLTSFSPNYLIYFLGLINIALTFFLTKKVFDKKIAYFSALLYAISPWIMYLELAGSEYIFIMFCLLVLFLGLFYLRSRYIQKFVFVLIVIVLIKGTSVSLISDVGLINAVNEFRGETSGTNFKLIGKVVENRYIYLSEHTVFNILKHISPVTYFTQEFRLLNFSFSPPIFVGFLIPFIFGLSLWVELFKKYKLKLLILLGLLIPSVLSRFSPDLTKLVIFSPVIFVTIAYGFTKILLPSRNKLMRFLLIVTILLVSVQMITTLLDIYTRENLRYQKSITNK